MGKEKRKKREVKEVIRTTRSELDNVIESFEDDMDEYLEIEEHEIQTEEIGDDMILTYGPLYVLEDLGLSVIEGVYCNRVDDTNDYEPDWSLTLIYETTDTEDFDYNDFVYFEQDPPQTALHNYLYAKNIAS